MEVFSFDADAWTSYALFEDKLGEVDRARSIFEIAITDAELDLPELLWKAYIDFEISHNEIENARTLFEKLLEKSQSLQIWESFADFEQQISIENCRSIYERAAQHFQNQNGDSEERAQLLQKWLDFEKSLPVNQEQRQRVEAIEKKMPKTINGELVFEEDDGDKEPSHLKIVAAAREWKSKN